MCHSSPIKELYNPKTFFVHAALLGQGFPHCRKFPTAASRRSLGRVSVPVWLFSLSAQLRIVDLVGRYPHQLSNATQDLPIPRPESLFKCTNFCLYILSSISSSFPELSSCQGLVPYVLLTRSPLTSKLVRSTCMY